ncbi:hypothetical protein BpHYR1_032505 [Brachionus plicatilis]|uniref:Uncharacterized protein n=1 Tax=Brachionus plicatilis TaxID=10195 RepID=A0A3M7Q492_BRAPC|nr:hypothetical protein BpHYR1_032505 [Brachionus plicatilis]
MVQIMRQKLNRSKQKIKFNCKALFIQTIKDIIFGDKYLKKLLFFNKSDALEKFLFVRYVGTGLSHSIPLVVRLVKEYKKGFESRYIESQLHCELKLIIELYLNIRKKSQIFMGKQDIR